MGKHVGKDMKNYFLQVYSKASCSTIPTDAWKTAPKQTSQKVAKQHLI